MHMYIKSRGYIKKKCKPRASRNGATLEDVSTAPKLRSKSPENSWTHPVPPMRPHRDSMLMGAPHPQTLVTFVSLLREPVSTANRPGALRLRGFIMAQQGSQKLTEIGGRGGWSDLGWWKLE